MEFRILGALEVRRAGETVPLPAGRAQIVLAILIAQQNQTVSAERLIRECWEGAPPATAPTQIHALISALRRQAGFDRAASPDRFAAIVTRSPGYRLSTDPAAVDAVRFQTHVDRARAAHADGRHALAVEHYRAALSLWRGEAFEGLASHQLAAERMRLEQLRMAALQELAAELLAWERPEDAAAELLPVVADQPFHEGLRSLLMVALSRSGRRADALATYRTLRSVLIDELGIEPGADIQRVHSQILAGPAQPARRAPASGPDTRPRSAPKLVTVR